MTKKPGREKKPRKKRITAKKFIENLRALLTKNKDNAKCLHVSEAFMKTLSKYPALVDIDVDDEENWTLYGIHLEASISIRKNAVLEMANGDFIILKDKKK